MTSVTSLQRRGLLKLGDAFIPGTTDLPSFSSLDPSDALPRALDYILPSDRKDFLMALSIFGALPSFFAKLVVWIAMHNYWVPGALAAPLRLMEIGFKGIVYTLYYADKRVHQKIKWDATINTKLKESDG